MIPPKTHSTHDLLELASLDAMGLLDAEEREDFERAFAAAPPAVQAQLRREQLRFASDASLPAVEVPLGLRARVLSAIMEKMQGMSGRRAGAAGALPLRTPSGVSRFWRVGAIGALAASLVLGYFSLQIFNENRGLRDAQASNIQTQYLLKEYGASFERVFYAADARLVRFSPAQDARAGKAAMLVSATLNEARLFVKELPVAGATYEVVVVDAQGRETSAVITIRDPGTGSAEATFRAGDVEGASKLLIRLQGAEKPIMSADGAGPTAGPQS